MLADSAYMLVFRIVHITAGVLWVGSVFLLSVFVAPAAEAIAPAGAPLMGELLGKRRLVDRIIGLGTITVVAGLFLYWHDWHLFPSFGDWLSSRFGGIAHDRDGVGADRARDRWVDHAPDRPAHARARRGGGGVGRAAHAGGRRTDRGDAAAPEGGRARGSGVPPVRGGRDVGGALPLT